MSKKLGFNPSFLFERVAQKGEPRSNFFRKFERASGIEPPSRPWQGRIIATIPRPQILPWQNSL